MAGGTGKSLKYKPLFAYVARDRYAHGATHAAVGKLLGVCERTVQRWTFEHEEFGEAYEEGKRAAEILGRSPEHGALPSPAEPATPSNDRREPIRKVERIFVEPPIRDR